MITSETLASQPRSTTSLSITELPLQFFAVRSLHRVKLESTQQGFSQVSDEEKLAMTFLVKMSSNIYHG